MNRVVITGLGIYSCIGKNLEEVKQSLFEGKSGIILDPVRKEFGYRSGLTGFVERPSLKGVLDRRARIMLPEQAEYAYVATVEALQNAGIDAEMIEKLEPEEKQNLWNEAKRLTSSEKTAIETAKAIHAFGQFIQLENES
ncbi:MAG: hypothetical protein EOP49_45510 [Sphingobacteriales bacterium]|nr:MAG: hypothetical protein EOP49_45510 [Sphingobacteriales bacterium]